MDAITQGIKQGMAGQSQGSPLPSMSHPSYRGAIICSMLGFGFLRFWMTVVGEQGAIFPDNDVLNNLNWLARGIFPLVMVVMLGARPLRKRVKDGSVLIATAVATLCSPAALIALPDELVFVKYLAVFCGISAVGWFYVCLGEVFLAMRIKDVALSMFSSLVVSTLLAYAASILSTSLTMLIVTITPLLTLFLLRHLDKNPIAKSPGAHQDERSKGDSPGERSRWDEGGERDERSEHSGPPEVQFVPLLGKWFLLLALYAIILGAIQAISNDAPGSLSNFMRYTIFSVTVLFTSVVFAVSLRSTQRLISLDLLWVIIAVAVCVTLIIAMIQQQAQGFVLSALAGIRYAVCGFMNIQLINMAQHLKRPVYVLLTAGWSVLMLFMALGYNFARFGFNELGLSASMTVILLLGILTMGSLLLIKVRPLSDAYVDLGSGATTASGAGTDNRLNRIRLLQRDYRLSEREVEVILLISQGHTQAYCADAMVLSVNTVRSHMKNLYTKLDIHSKEELLEMLNSVADE